jgi:hypothetical protein
MKMRYLVIAILSVTFLVYCLVCLQVAVQARTTFEYLLTSQVYDSFLETHVSEEVFRYWLTERDGKNVDSKDLTTRVEPVFAVSNFVEATVWLKYTYHSKGSPTESGFGVRDFPVLLKLRRVGMGWYVYDKEEKAY